jgi:large subunit ribosomal protein L29
MNKELRSKTNEELCSLIMRLKLQLLESRFRMAAGELEKTSNISEIRKTIARALTILTQREVKLSIGTHGIVMYDLKNKTTKSITNVVQDALNANAPKEGKKTSSKTTDVKEAIKQATVSATNKTTDDTPISSSTPIVKKELKSHMEKKAKKEIIHKTVGGGA